MSDDIRHGDEAADDSKSRSANQPESVSHTDSRAARIERLIQEQRDRRDKGVMRMTVNRDGTEHQEFVPTTDPRLAPLASLIEEQLSVEIIMGSLGVPWEDIDQAGLQPTAFSIAEEIDYYYTVVRRENAQADARRRGGEAPGSGNESQLATPSEP